LNHAPNLLNRFDEIRKLPSESSGWKRLLNWPGREAGTGEIGSGKCRVKLRIGLFFRRRFVKSASIAK